MSFSIRSLQKLLYEIQKWPGIGPRSAQKLIVHLLKRKEQDIPLLIQALENIMTGIKKCPKCFGWMEGEQFCSICQDASRDQSSLCIVENPFDIFRIERSQVFHGYYHVLHGLISPLNNVTPEDLTIQVLMERIDQCSVKELILALDTNLEGDTTSLYLVSKLKPLHIKISKLASGIPLGSPLDFIDDQTLTQAIENRIEI